MTLTIFTPTYSTIGPMAQPTRSCQSIFSRTWSIGLIALSNRYGKYHERSLGDPPTLVQNKLSASVCCHVAIRVLGGLLFSFVVFFCCWNWLWQAVLVLSAFVLVTSWYDICIPVLRIQHLWKCGPKTRNSLKRDALIKRSKVVSELPNYPKSLATECALHNDNIPLTATARSRSCAPTAQSSFPLTKFSENDNRFRRTGRGSHSVPRSLKSTQDTERTFSDALDHNHDDVLCTEVTNTKHLFSDSPCFLLTTDVAAYNPHYRVVQPYHLNTLFWRLFSTSWEWQAVRWSIVSSVVTGVAYTIVKSTIRSNDTFFTAAPFFDWTIPKGDFSFMETRLPLWLFGPIALTITLGLPIELFAFLRWLCRSALHQPSFVQEGRLWSRGSHIGCFASELEALGLDRLKSSNVVSLFPEIKHYVTVNKDNAHGQPVNVQRGLDKNGAELELPATKRIALNDLPRWFFACYPSLEAIPDNCHASAFSMRLHSEHEKLSVEEKKGYGLWFPLSFPSHCELVRQGDPTPNLVRVEEEPTIIKGDNRNNGDSSGKSSVTASNLNHCASYLYEKLNPPIYTNTVYPFRCDPPLLYDLKMDIMQKRNVPVGCYRCYFKMPWTLMRSDRTEVPVITLKLQGCGPAVYVFLNGCYVGYSTDGFLASEFDVTSFLVWNLPPVIQDESERDVLSGVNCLVLVCPKWCSASFLEDQDQWWLSGCFRDVELVRWPLRREVMVPSRPQNVEREVEGGVAESLSTNSKIMSSSNGGTVGITETTAPQLGHSISDMDSITTNPVEVHALCLEDVFVTPYIDNAESCSELAYGVVEISVRFGCSLDVWGHPGTLLDAIRIHKQATLGGTNWLSKFGIRVQVFYCGHSPFYAKLWKEASARNRASLGFSPYDFSTACGNPNQGQCISYWTKSAQCVASSKVKQLSIFSSALETSTSFSCTVAVRVPTPFLWSDEYPHIYIASVSLIAFASEEPPTKDQGSISLNDPKEPALDDEVLQCEATFFGFRSVCIRGGELLVNGRQVKIKGVNRHEHHPLLGKRIPSCCMLDDIMLLKQYNFNAVRLAHYPNDPFFYTLCDIFGLYVVDEANIETHGDIPLGWSVLLSILTFRISPFPLNRLANDPDWRIPWLLRIYRMVFRDTCHPCVILWSLGNEAGVGTWPREAKRGIDTMGCTGIGTRDYRPVQYEPGGSPPDCSDIVCPMYLPVENVIRYAVQSAGVSSCTPGTHAVFGIRRFFLNVLYRCCFPFRPLRVHRAAKRPLILCEYQHAMGNSNGSLAEYWKAFESFSYLQGGFIWDWVDQGFLKRAGKLERVPYPEEAESSIDHKKNTYRTPVNGGLYYWAYGGDFGDVPHDRNFNINGLLYPDRTLKPAMVEVKYVQQPIYVQLESVSLVPLESVMFASEALSFEPSTTMRTAPHLKTFPWEAPIRGLPEAHTWQQRQHAAHTSLCVVLKIFNKHNFKSLESFSFYFTLKHLHFTAVQSGGRIHLPANIGPASSGIACLFIPGISADDSGLVFSLIVAAQLNRALSWAPKGHVVARQQLWVRIPDHTQLQDSSFLVNRTRRELPPHVSFTPLSTSPREEQQPAFKLPKGHPRFWTVAKSQPLEATEKPQHYLPARDHLSFDHLNAAPGWWVRNCPGVNTSAGCCCERKKDYMARTVFCNKSADNRAFPLKHPLIVNGSQEPTTAQWVSAGILELIHSDSWFTVRVNCVTGTVESLAFLKSNLKRNKSDSTAQSSDEIFICGPIQYNFYRAPTDNDEGGGDVLAPALPFIRDVGILSLVVGSIALGFKRTQGIMSYASRWRKAGLDRMESRLVKLRINPDFIPSANTETQLSSITMVIEQVHGPRLSSLRCKPLKRNLARSIFGTNYFPPGKPLTNNLFQAPSDALPIDPLFKSLSTFQLYPNGTFKFNPRIAPYDFVVAYKLPPLPRIGITFCLPTSFRDVAYCGCGPHENYCDRRSSAIKDVFTSTVDAMHEPYIVPSECGGREEVDWISVMEPTTHARTAAKGQTSEQLRRGLLVQVANTTTTTSGLHCSVSPYSVEEIAKAKHQTELGVGIIPRPLYAATDGRGDALPQNPYSTNAAFRTDAPPLGDTVHLNVDFRHMGVGGECSWFPCVARDFLINAAPTNTTETMTKPRLPKWGVPIIVSPLQHESSENENK